VTRLAGYAGVRCVFEAQAETAAPCAAGVPRALQKRLDKARVVFERADGTGRMPLVRRALGLVDRADKLRYRLSAHGAITPECSAAITRIVRRLQAGAASWAAGS
jgi:sirohydrochlorin ferrochelatase